MSDTSCYFDPTPAPLPTPAPPCGAGVGFSPDIDQLPRHTLESAVRAAALVMPLDAITPAALGALLADDRETLAPIYDEYELHEIEGLVNFLVGVVRAERRHPFTAQMFAFASRLVRSNATAQHVAEFERALSGSFRRREWRVAMQRVLDTTPPPAPPVAVSVSLPRHVKTYYDYFCMTYMTAEFDGQLLLSLAQDADGARRGRFLPPCVLPSDFFAMYASAPLATQNEWLTTYARAHLINARNELRLFIAPAFAAVFPCMMLAVERRTFTDERAVTWFLSHDVVRQRYMPVTILAQVTRIMAYFQHDAEHWVDPVLETALVLGVSTKGLCTTNTPGARAIIRQYVKMKMKKSK